MTLEKHVEFILNAGLATSVALIVIGMTLLFIKGGAAGQAITALATTNSPINSATFHISTLSGIVSLNGVSFIFLGIIVMIATPVARILVSLLTFALERNALYTAITLIVFADLLIAIFIIPMLIG